MFRETGAQPIDTQEFGEIPRSIEGVVAGALLTEMGDNRIKVSLRSRPGYNVERVAAHFGGGGHPQAAGCVVSGSISEVEENVVRALAGMLAKEED
jgi:phosphoesterase RecJ-like protein